MAATHSPVGLHADLEELAGEERQIGLFQLRLERALETVAEQLIHCFYNSSSSMTTK